jgi:hypothetical protein
MNIRYARQSCYGLLFRRAVRYILTVKAARAANLGIRIMAGTIVGGYAFFVFRQFGRGASLVPQGADYRSPHPQHRSCMSKTVAGPPRYSVGLLTEGTPPVPIFRNRQMYGATTWSARRHQYRRSQTSRSHRNELRDAPRNCHPGSLVKVQR